MRPRSSPCARPAPPSWRPTCCPSGRTRAAPRRHRPGRLGRPGDLARSRARPGRRAGQQRRRRRARAAAGRDARGVAADLRHQRHRSDARHPGPRPADAAGARASSTSARSRPLSGHAAAAYTASKWALRGLTRSASLELGSTRGIRVNAVMPGLVDTPLMESAPPAFFDAAIAEVPLGRVGVPADIAPTIVFLVSDDCGLLQRRRDRHRRRPDRPRVPQGHRRRHQDRVDEARHPATGCCVSSSTVQPTCCRHRSASSSGWGSSARWRSVQRRCGRRTDRLRRRGPPAALPAAGDPRLRHLRDPRRGRTALDRPRRPASRTRGTTRRRSTSPTRTRSTARATRSRDRRPAAPWTSRWRWRASSAPTCGLPSLEASQDAIFGYTILNDWSARDIQSREMQVGLGPAKGKDFATSFGPWIVTADEVHAATPGAGPRLPGVRQRRARRARRPVPHALLVRRDARPRRARLRRPRRVTCWPPGRPVEAGAWPSSGVARGADASTPRAG